MTLSEELSKLECPLNWGLPQSSSTVELTRKKVSFKVDHEVGEEDDESSTWQKICQCLIMSVLEYNSPDIDLKVIDRYLKNIEGVLKEEKGDTLMKKHMPNVEYVMKAMQAHYYYKLEDEEKAKECFSSLKPLCELSQNDQAACYALRSCCFMEYSPVHRTRRFSLQKFTPSIEELQSLGKSVKSDHCSPYHLVFCAQSLLEYAQNCDFMQGDPEAARSFYEKCTEMFRRAAAKGENNGVVLVRTAKGLMHLWHYGIEDLLEHCVFRSLELLPTSGFVNAVVGEWYYIRHKDVDKAIPYLRIASREHKIMSSYRYLLNILFAFKSTEELDEEMDGYWKKFSKESDIPLERIKALKPMAAYYFFVKDDILKTVKYWKEFLETTDEELRVSSANKFRRFVFKISESAKSGNNEQILLQPFFS